MPNCLYDVAKDFQTLMVGFLGFSGVIITLYINAYLSRKQHEHNIDHEKKVLRAALSAELNSIKEIFTKLGNVGEDRASLFSNNGYPFPDNYSQIVYQSLIAKIGILSPSEISAVTKAYSLTNELPVSLSLLSEIGYTRLGYLFISSLNIDKATKIYKDFLPEIENALLELQHP